MRIRKNAKFSHQLYTTSSLKPGTLIQTHICQLNQSPWDVTTFSPPSQFDINNDYAQNVTSMDSIEVVERDISNGFKGGNDNSGGTTTDKAEPPVILCGKTDGKSWQCRRVAVEGSSLCEHHLSINRKSEKLAAEARKKSEKSKNEVDQRRPHRPKRGISVTSSSTNPSEFYYYSGFGPSWGKKRGSEVNKDNGYDDVLTSLENECELSPSMLARFDEEIDYGDENEDENEDRKKRARKPIKARSLKSLM